MKKSYKILVFSFLILFVFLGAFYSFSQYFSWFQQDGLVAFYKLGEKQEVLNENKHYRFDDIDEISSWNLYEDTSTASISLSSDSEIGSGSAVINVTSSDGTTSGRIQLLKSGFSLVSGRTYILSFYAKADTSFVSSIVVKKDSNPWNSYGLSESETFSTSWQKYEYKFNSNTTDSSARVDFSLGFSLTGTNIWIDDLVLYEVLTGNEIGDKHAEVYGVTYTDDQSGNSYGAMEFDGVNDYVSLDSCASNIAGKNFTISTWIKGPSQDHKGIVSINTSTGENRALWLIRTAGMGIYDGSTWYIGNINVGNNIWHHVVITYKKGVKEAKLYADGSLDSTFITGNEINITENDKISIGQEWDSNTLSDFFDGSISDVRIYNYALSDSEISAIFQERSRSSLEMGSLNKGLVGYWPLDGIAETKDSTSYDNHGINNGAVLADGVNGESEGSYSFDGNDNILLGDLLDVGTNDMTFSFWMKSTQDYGYIISKAFAGGGNSRYAIGLRGESVNKSIYVLSSWNIGGHVPYSTSTIVATGEWVYVVVLFDRNGQLKIYKDGVNTDNFDISAYNNYDMNSVYPFRFGSYTASDQISPSGFYNGELSDVRVYNRVLSDDEIHMLYDYGGKNIERSTGDLNKGLVLDMPLTDKTLDTEATENLIPETNFANWSIDASGGSVIGTRTAQSDGSVLIEDVDSNTRLRKDMIPISLNTDYTVSVSFKKLSGTPTFRWQIQGRNSSSTTLDTYWTQDLQYHVEDIDGWQHLSYTFNFTNPDITQVFLWFQDGADYTVYTHSYYLKEPQLEQKDHSTLFIDGIRPEIIKDSSSYRNDGTVDGAIVGVDSTEFDGTDDYIDCDSVVIPNEDFSISVFINPDQISDNNVILAQYTSGDSGRFTFMTRGDGSIRFQIGSSADSSVSKYTTDWIHIVVVYNYIFKTVSFYFDGEFDESVTAVFGEMYNGENTVIGAMMSDGTYPFAGDMSGLKIYNRALSSSEVKMLYDMGR